jgi:glycerophosphoryl diester phosphodiesterase
MAQDIRSIPLCFGHRGASLEAPENTARAFARAMALGADGVELDVRMTADGVAVVFHDATLARLARAPDRIDRLTWAQLKKFRIGGEPVPRLAEVLEIVGERGIVQIEIKARAALAAAVRAVGRAGAADRVILASFDHATIRQAAVLAPKLVRMLITDPPRGRVTETAGALQLLRVMAALGASGVSLDHRAITSEAFVTIFRRRAVRLWCWTVDEPAEMRRLAACGVDAILSNDPARLLRTLGRA